MMTTPDAAVEATEKAEQEPVNVHYDTRLPDLPWSRRIQIPIIAAAVYGVIRILGPTLRYEVLGWQHAERVYAAKKQCIWAFWHRVIIPVVGAESRRRGNEHDGFRRPMDAQSDRVAGLRHGAGKLDAWRITRTRGDGA